MSQPKQKQRESVKAVTYGLEEDATALAETISAGSCGCQIPPPTGFDLAVRKQLTAVDGFEGILLLPFTRRWPQRIPSSKLPTKAVGMRKRFCELAAYFTQVNLQPLFKFKNYKTSDSFARRLLVLRPRLEVVRNILQACEMNESDEHTLCAVPYRDIPTKKFSLRFASYLPPY
ncbi:hypothetical protein pipiens_019058 [Culex pipiens pipiens]|uniref:Coatomer alpha subunit C-terminal domain-containing protein n=1 Tax=Culex pipiens pipiens TaxID=38569 RepID=A0ABD1DWI8_CULPP